jgi:hypothetical protein
MAMILVEPNQAFEEFAQLDPWMVDCYLFSSHTKGRVAQGLKSHGSQNQLSYLGLGVHEVSLISKLKPPTNL